MKRVFNMKEDNGITLIALVITIIVLLILAGVAIAQLTDIGLFQKTKLSKARSQEAAAEEELNLEIMRVQTEKGGKASIKDIYNDFKRNENSKIEVIEVESEDLATISYNENKVKAVIKEIKVMVAGYSQFDFSIDTTCTITKICGVAKNEWNGELSKEKDVIKEIDVIEYIKGQEKATSEFFTMNKPSNQFSSSWLIDTTRISDLYYGHWEKWGTYTATFNLNYDKLGIKTSSGVKVLFHHCASTSSSSCSTYAQVFYTDGTSSDKVNSTFVENEKWCSAENGTQAVYQVEMDVDRNKTVDYIQLTISGYDANNGSYYGGIKNMYLYNSLK